MSEENVNKRVAKNAILLTLRMVLVTIVGLYTSRVIIEALGIDDYGIYGVIGGVVGMAAFLNASMAGATSRFITFSLGRGNEEETKKIFATTLAIHILIAVFVAILGETVGLWFVNHKMKFPDGSMLSVNVLYQFTIISMFLSFTQVPYSADIMAREKMGVYAYFEIINVSLKLAIVFSLFLFQEYRLIWFASLTLLLSAFNVFLYRIYCIKHFKESKTKPFIDKSIAKKVLSFSGYDLYGNMCVVAMTQGNPIILNVFFGVVVNAASSLATTVSGAISGFCSSVHTAFRPQIIKSYANQDFTGMETMMRRSIIFTLLVFGILAIPVIIEAPTLIFLWLGRIPEYMVTFLRLIVLCSYINNITLVNNTAIHATGNIRNISFISGTFYLLCPVVNYFILKYSFPTPNAVYIVNIIMMSGVSILGFIFVKRQIPALRILKYITGIFKNIILFLTILLLGIVIKKSILDNLFTNQLSIEEGLLSLVLVTLFGGISLLSTNYLIVMNKGERAFIMSKASRLFNRVC